jgi:Spy/CpxP family protein refolding chaperone
MTRTKSLALAFYLGAALAGAAVGVSVDRLVVRAQPRWWDQAAMRKHTFDELKLTLVQRDSVGRIYDERDKKQALLIAPLRPSLDSASVEARQRISQLLTPEQKAIYDQMQRVRDSTRAQHTEKK